MKSKILTILKILIGWPLSLVALLFIGKLILSRGNDIAQLLHPQIDLLVISIIFFLMYFSLRAYFWHQLLRAKGHDISLQKTPFLWSLSELQRYIPGNIWSFLGRTNLFSDRGIEKKTILYSLLHEAQFLVIAGALVSLLSTQLILHTFFHYLPLWPTFITLLVILGGGVFVFVKNGRFFKSKKVSLLFPQLSSRTNLGLLLPMMLAFLFYGLGNFFAVASWFSLIHANLYITSAFFVFSFLVGYLSFVTPMGLGVREAVTTAGLTPYMSIANAGLASLASRLVLIVSELLFVGFAFLLSRVGKQTVRRFELFWGAHKYTIILTLSILLYIAYFTTASFLRYTNYYTGRFDLGNMDQTVWNSAHGRVFQLTNPDGTNIISRLSVHADFILILLAPLYYIWQDPRMLLLIQTVVLSLGAIFVYKIAQKVLKHNGLSLTLAILFLINPGVNQSNLYDFHAVTLATTFLLGAWYYLLENKIWPFMLFLVLAGLTKEEVWMIAGLLAVAFGVLKKRYIVGSLMAAFSFGLFYYIFFHAIPSARGGNHFALSYYSDFGSTPTGVIRTIFLSPLKTLHIIFEKGQLEFLTALLMPLGFLALFFPFMLIFAGPDLAIDLLSQNAQLHSIYYQYTADITPFVILSCIYAIWWMRKYIQKLNVNFFIGFLIVMGILGAYIFGPLPGAIHQNIDMFTQPLTYHDDIDTFLNSIPHKYSVAATNNVGSHLSHRQKIYTIPTGIDKADIIVMLLNDQFAQPSLKAQKELATKLQSDPRYNEVFRLNDFDVFIKKGVKLRPVPKERYNHQPILPSFK